MGSDQAWSWYDGVSAWAGAHTMNRPPSTESISASSRRNGFPFRVDL